MSNFFRHADDLMDAVPEEPIDPSLIQEDLDSDGDPPPPAGDYVDPMTLEDSYYPVRANADVKLPHYQPKERSRIREQYEPKVSYEEWIDGEIAPTRGQGGGGRKREVKKLEEDSDLPVGKSYFWHAFCRQCGETYHPHIPGSWACPVCRTKVWQQPDDPESKTCAICDHGVAKMREVKGHKIRNPMQRNSHICKRCGRIVCDFCYSPVLKKLEELGYAEPQRVCTDCIKDVDKMSKPPDEEDLGTLHEQDVGQTEETALYQPFWTPKCVHCNITFGRPPKKWMCPSCKAPVWQSTESAEATKCWMCPAKFPKVRCHKCGQLACHACAAYAQPLPELGFDDGAMRSVCKGCYGGVSLRPQQITETVEDTLRPKPWPAQCPACKATTSAPPEQWISKCHRRKSYQPPDHPSSKKCSLCSVAIKPDTSENCLNCGRLVCTVCSQYKQPLPERGFAKGASQTVCKACFNPKVALLPDHTDFPFWPPHCTRCDKSWATPPDRWKCPVCHDLVWQPTSKDALVASRSCFTCGKKLIQGATNCRMCGRVVCNECGTNRAEVVERGFVRGQLYQVCTICTKSKKSQGPGEGATPAPASAAGTTK